MPNPGLKAGFVELGSTTEAILRALHDNKGQMRQHDLVIATDRKISAVSMSLLRMKRAGMVFRWPPPVDHQYDGVKAQDWWYTKPYQGRRKIESPSLTMAERTRNYKLRKKATEKRVPSVFQWRP